MSKSDLEKDCIAVVRGFAMDGPQAAKNGHPGTAMALAPLAYTLWTRIMRYDASEPDWPNRDRFILSAGHASILLYSMLYLTGYGLTKQDIENFRQWDSLTPGHPEVGHTAGVEVTTGPLGQGFANGVGMAIAEHHLRARFGEQLFNHHTFVVAGDGCLMEGVSHEAASLAGHLGLDKLVVIYDDNHITIDGPTELALNDDAGARFESYGWYVERAGEIANDPDLLEAAVRRAMAVEGKPAMVIVRSHIGYPSPKFTDTSKAHGDPFGAEEIKATKEIMGIPADAPFWCPDEVVSSYRDAGSRGAAERKAWETLYAAWPDNKAEIAACLASQGLPGWEEQLPRWAVGDKAVATRNASKSCLDAVIDVVPGLIGGGADLTGNTGVLMSAQEPFSELDRSARQIHFGVREHGMGAIMNGMAHHGGVLPIGGTFFVFSDYMRPAIRLAALMRQRVIHVLTHDSIGLGEDGPTHQPVEHLASLRAMPGLFTFRPGDAMETAESWELALRRADGPSILALSRQTLPSLRGDMTENRTARGGYVLAEADGPRHVTLLATGSEVAIAMDARMALASEGINATVVSMPCWELFAQQDESYRASVLGTVLRVGIEAGVSMGWDRWLGPDGIFIGMSSFGASAPFQDLYKHFGITPDAIVSAVKKRLG